MLDATHVIWEPYIANVIARRYPGGISDWCTRDHACWLTKSKIIFDVSVEEMAQQRVMRQFGARQVDDPPLVNPPLPPHVHRFVFFFMVFHMSIVTYLHFA
jgi:hypothetical protein